MIAAEWIFWISVGAIFYIFFGYLFLLKLMSMMKSDKHEVSVMEQYPHVTLLVSACNEENVIAEKIKNALALDYPKEKLEILVVSDASTDGTDEIVKGFATSGVKLLRQEQRAGKTSALNIALTEVKGNVVIFSDANSMYNENAVKEMVKHFEDQAIGFVSGRTKYVSSESDMVADSTGLYTRMEIMTKCLESKVTSCVGADGAIFAIRKSLYLPLKAYDINDFVIPLNVIEQGFRGILEKNAFCVEETAKDAGGEFNRQVRITCRTIRAIYNNRTLLNPYKYPLFSFALFSHKIFKFMLPVFMLIALVSNLLLVAKSIFFILILSLQCMYYFLCFYGYLERKKDESSRLPSFAYTFGSVCLAFLFGWYKYFSGETYTTWSSERL